MESDKHLLSVENNKTKTTFRKPTNDGVNRKYRRHTPVSGTSSSDESSKRNSISSPMYSEEDKVSEKQDRKDTARDNRGYNQSEHVRNCDSHRYSRSSQGSGRYDDYKNGKHALEEDRHYSRPRLFHSDHRERRSEFSRSRNNYRDVDNYSRDMAGSDRRHRRHNADESAYNDCDKFSKDRDNRDERRDSHRTSRERKRYEECRGYRDDSCFKRESGRHLHKDANKNESRSEGEKGINEERKKHDEKYASRHKDADYKDLEEQLKDIDADVTDHNESAPKRQKYDSCDNADTKIHGSKQGQDVLQKMAPHQANTTESAGDVDAAKDAAMKAAALVNQNLYGAGTMTADQKKKLLWGNKKKNTAEETSQRWNTAIFPDHERQEKFNKLMSLRLPWYIWPIVGCEGRLQGGTKANQQPPPSREGSNGSREAVHCRTQAKGWSHCWSRPLNEVRPCLSSYHVMNMSTKLALYLSGKFAVDCTAQMKGWPHYCPMFIVVSYYDF